MAVFNSFGRKKWDDGATAKPVAATELDGHQQENGAPAGFFNWIVCSSRELSSPKIAVACPNGMAVSYIGDGIEGFDPVFAVLPVPEKEKTENLSIDRLKEARLQYYLQCQVQSHGAGNGESLCWFSIESIGLDHFNPSRFSTRTPHRNRQIRDSLAEMLTRTPLWFPGISASRSLGGAL